VKRQSVDQKQVLHQRNVEDERRHRLQTTTTKTALNDDVADETAATATESTDDDSNDSDITPSPLPTSQPTTDDVRSRESLSEHGNSNPTVVPPDHGMY